MLIVSKTIESDDDDGLFEIASIFKKTKRTTMIMIGIR